MVKVEVLPVKVRTSIRQGRSMKSTRCRCSDGKQVARGSGSPYPRLTSVPIDLCLSCHGNFQGSVSEGLVRADPRHGVIAGERRAAERSAHSMGRRFRGFDSRLEHEMFQVVHQYAVVPKRHGGFRNVSTVKH